MDHELNNLKSQFDEIIATLKNTSEYQDYIKAKTILENCDTATTTNNEIKDLQKIRVNTTDEETIQELSEHIDLLHEKYDKIFEVAQFNQSYERLCNLVNKIKEQIEAQVN